MLKIVNQTVPAALARLGYSDLETDDIIKYISQHETIEGAPWLHPEHLSVFDCAFRAKNGQRSIEPMGHVRMLAAVQPFLSGAISKTTNVPETATVEDIERIYIEAWRLGLKSITVYRDGSKRSQPLATNQEAQAGDGKSKELPSPVRRTLPLERAAITHKFSVAGHEGYATVGLFPDGAPGELFITMSKEGSTVSGLMDTIATSVSLALQYGVPIAVLVNKFSHMRFEPSGFTGNPELPIAKSLIDYIFRWLGNKFMTKAPISPPPVVPVTEREVAQLTADAPLCRECGTITVRAGACFACPSCGTSSGCG
jgi:ribonucleoside-diphosphate reductase alpha chain